MGGVSNSRLARKRWTSDDSAINAAARATNDSRVPKLLPKLTRH
jgi:hypothetical protein